MAFQESYSFRPSAAPKFTEEDGQVIYTGDTPFFFDANGIQTDDSNAARIMPNDELPVIGTKIVRTSKDGEEKLEARVIVDFYGYPVEMPDDDLIGF